MLLCIFFINVLTGAGRGVSFGCFWRFAQARARVANEIRELFAGVGRCMDLVSDQAVPPFDQLGHVRLARFRSPSV